MTRALKYVDADGVKVSYRESGGGEPVVVFVHGALGSSLTWVYQLKAAKEGGFKALALDLPGHGESEDLVGEVDIARLAEIVEKFMDALGVERAVLVGHSMGGAIAMTMAVDHPQRLSGLVLANTGAKLGVLPEILEGLEKDYQRTVAEVIAPLAFSRRTDPKLVEASIAEMLKVPLHVALRNFKACNSFDLRSKLGEVRAPTLIIAGDEDRLTPLKWAEYLRNNIEGARLKVIEGCGHIAMLEKPLEFNRALMDFLARLSLN
ncbi:MAG: alpha/beta hydrolase [Thermoprotei archaeon]|nr:MAG: alpha/beta hydrolase [Thermoprotei archaeon]